jgi:hypothetical protein
MKPIACSYFRLNTNIPFGCKYSRLNRQIWYRHPNSEAGNDEIQNFQSLVNMDFYFVGITF